MTLSVNLSGPLPPPYKMLYGFENTTQELKVSAQHTYINPRIQYKHVYICLYTYPQLEVGKKTNERFNYFKLVTVGK